MVLSKARLFLVDYCYRHRHPANAVAHLVGVPMAFFGLYQLICRQPGPGIALLVAGYFLQYLGHKAQGNEVGELTLMKAVWRRLAGRSTELPGRSSDL